MTAADANANSAAAVAAAATLRLQTPQEYLAAADREFADGNHDDGSELLYQAVVCALTQLAEAYGRPCGTRAELKAFAGWLDEKHGGDGRHARKLRTAETFHHNAQYHFLYPEDIDVTKPSVHDFVATLSSYRQKVARYG